MIEEQTMKDILASFSAEEILGIISAVAAGLVTVITAVGKIVNEIRRKNGKCTCGLTGRPLKPRKKRNASNKGGG